VYVQELKDYTDFAIGYPSSHLGLQDFKGGICETWFFNFNLNPGQPRTVLQLKLVGILTTILFLT
jgi:hypothetical protein